MQKKLFLPTLLAAGMLSTGMAPPSGGIACTDEQNATCTREMGCSGQTCYYYDALNSCDNKEAIWCSGGCPIGTNEKNGPSILCRK